jgi:hypothetical protein
MKVILTYNVNHLHELTGVTVKILNKGFSVTILGKVTRSKAIEYAVETYLKQ